MTDIQTINIFEIIFYMENLLRFSNPLSVKKGVSLLIQKTIPGTISQLQISKVASIWYEKTL